MTATTPQPERGDVWFADVPGDKRRPVVVLTRSSVLPRLMTILVAPVTTRVREIPTEVPLGPAQGLARQCVANFDNILPLLLRTSSASWSDLATTPPTITGDSVPVESRWLVTARWRDGSRGAH